MIQILFNDLNLLGLKPVLQKVISIPMNHLEVLLKDNFL